MNAEINRIPYEKSKWLFEVDNHMLFSKIRTYLTNHPTIRKYIRNDTYIVIRRVKNTDKHMQHESNFDNYKETFVIPQRQPKGELMAWFSARRNPKSFIEHFFTKAFFFAKSGFKFYYEEIFIKLI